MSIFLNRHWLDFNTSPLQHHCERNENIIDIARRGSNSRISASPSYPIISLFHLGSSELWGMSLNNTFRSLVLSLQLHYAPMCKQYTAPFLQGPYLGRVFTSTVDRMCARVCARAWACVCVGAREFGAHAVLSIVCHGGATNWTIAKKNASSRSRQKESKVPGWRTCFGIALLLTHQACTLDEAWLSFSLSSYLSLFLLLSVDCLWPAMPD